MKVPVHVAIIMDGNGRWAEKRGLPRVVGHRYGAEVITNVIEESLKLGIKFLTFYAFSIENWNRPKEEVDTLIELLKEYLDKKREDFFKQSIRFKVIGRIADFPVDVYQKINQLAEETKNNSRLVLNLALSYGSRTEIVEASQKIVRDVSSGLLDNNNITEETFAKYLYTADMPDPDLFIRTSGELRLSNFLLWQLSYTELYFSRKFWPAFTKKDFRHAVKAYSERERRFGRIN